MTTTGRMVGLFLMLAVPPVFAEKAVSNEGSSDSSSGSSGTATGSSSGTATGSSGHSGSGTSSSGSSWSGSGSSDSGSRAVPRGSSGSDYGSVGRHSGGSRRGDDGASSGGSSGGYAQSDAERRSPRPRNTRGDDDHHSGYSRGGRILYGHYGSHYHGTVYYPYSCYDYHYSYWDYPYRNRSYGDTTGAVRVLVDPKETKVFVDGYYAGIADDFDGIFQRLYLPPGRHQITLKLDGFKTHRVQIYSARGHTIKLHHDMVQGDGEDEPVDMAGPGMDDRDDEARLEGEDDMPGRETSGRKIGLGTLRLSVNPKDAAVYVDGEFWGNGLSEDLKLPAGRHEIAVVRPGFHSYERQVEIRADDTVELDIDLRKS